MADGMAIVDTRLDVKVSTFDGADANWFAWCLRFEAYVGLLGLSAFVNTAAIQPAELDMATFGINAAATSDAYIYIYIPAAIATLQEWEQV